MYGLMIGALNASKPELGQEILEKLGITLQEAFDTVNPYKVVQLTIF